VNEGVARELREVDEKLVSQGSPRKKIGSIPRTAWMKILHADKSQVFFNEIENQDAQYAFKVSDFCYRNDIKLSSREVTLCREILWGLSVGTKPEREGTRSIFKKLGAEVGFNQLHGKRLRKSKPPKLSITATPEHLSCPSDI
jgi:hypothetical protein